MTTTAVRISACVDCGTAIIGERLRCPACHQVHASSLVAVPIEDRSGSGLNLLARWVLAAELICGVALGIAIAVRGCTS